MDMCCRLGHLYCLAKAGAMFLISLCIAGADDEDEVVPLKLKATKRFVDKQVIGLEIGGQMAFILTTTKTEAHGGSHTPPEPAPADAHT